RGHRKDDHHDRAEDDLNRALVVEGARGQVGPQHQAVTASFIVRSAMPTSGPSTSIKSGATTMRSVRAAERVGSIGSTDTPRRSSRLRRAASTTPITRPPPPRKTREKRWPDRRSWQ